MYLYSFIHFHEVSDSESDRSEDIKINMQL